MDPISRDLQAHYTAKFAEHGPTPRGVDWNRTADVELRYEKMLAVARDNAAGATWLDVGCGYGGLLEYAGRTGRELAYTGIDVSAPMIEFAARQFPAARFECADLFDLPAGGLPAGGPGFDYVVCNGILTQKLGAGIQDMERFARRLIQAMFALCRRGAAFNVMTSRVNFTAPNLFYKSPVEMLAFCLDEVTTRVLLDHSYPLYEYTVYLYRD